MVNDFREQLFLAYLKIGKSVDAEFVQGQAEQCCRDWGHDYNASFESPRRWELSPIPQTIGGTPVVSDLKCRRCGHTRHPKERNEP